ncbi:MAG: hypothetical protein Q7S25_05480 [Candidatus Limnocylindria bacterium]|nr:hypothetical protein [Candidatus Limnocylindria bacterium]
MSSRSQWNCSAVRRRWQFPQRTSHVLEHFPAGLARVRERIEQRPAAGTPQKQDDAYVLRMYLSPRPLPYLVYYAYRRRQQPIREIFLMRLYASGQDRLDFGMSEWPW